MTFGEMMGMVEEWLNEHIQMPGLFDGWSNPSQWPNLPPDKKKKRKVGSFFDLSILIIINLINMYHQIFRFLCQSTLSNVILNTEIHKEWMNVLHILCTMNTIYYVHNMYRMYLVYIQYIWSIYSKLIRKILKIPK